MNWPLVQLGDLIEDITAGKSFGASNAPAEEGHWGIIKVSAMTWGKFKPEENKAVPAELADPRFEIREGDLLVSRANTAEYVGASVLVRAVRPKLLLSDKSLRLTPKSSVHPEWLWYTLQAPAVRSQIRELATGTKDSMRNISQSALRTIRILIPPLDEQRRIVDLLEDHLSRLDAAETYVRNAMQKLRLLKASVLASLHAGEPYPLGALAVDSGYGTSVKCVADGKGAAVVRIPNLVDGQIDLSDEKRVLNAEADTSAYMLAPGDVLIVRTNGSVDLIGRSAVVQPGIDAAFASYLIRYRVREEVVRPRWVQIMLSTPQVRSRIESLAASSAGQHNLSLSKLNPLELPVPPITTQDAGIQLVVGMEVEASRLAASIAATRLRAARLRSSILAAAFSGRLTTSESDLSLNEELIDA
ncbi:restriction endonuclease subunit S [Mycobacterium camsae]|uniref:restriction endonuclease subunit S n=1 Tax=Mycobacterium gordonae TaxID=1778 RepID=UPI00197D9DD7|nr:restriction endonuclease subunit S [Mycobacterium gordonae]